MPAGNEPDVFFVCTRQFKFQEKLEAFLVAFQELNLELNQTWYFVCTRKFKLTSWAFPEGLLLQVLEPSPSGQGSNLDQILKLWNQDTNLLWTRNDKLEDFCTDEDLTQIWNWHGSQLEFPGAYKKLRLLHFLPCTDAVDWALDSVQISSSLTERAQQGAGERYPGHIWDHPGLHWHRWDQPFGHHVHHAIPHHLRRHRILILRSMHAVWPQSGIM